MLWEGVIAVNFGHPLRALHASPSRSEGEVLFACNHFRAVNFVCRM